MFLDLLLIFNSNYRYNKIYKKESGEVMKRVFLGIIIGIILCSGLVYGATLYNANDISYTTSDDIETNVNDALNELYNVIVESSVDNLKVDILSTGFNGTYYDNGNQRLDITLSKDYKFIVATGSVKRTYAVGGAFYPLKSGTELYSNTNISNGSFAQIVKNMTKGSVYSIGAGNDGTTGNYTLSVIGFY